MVLCNEEHQALYIGRDVRAHHGAPSCWNRCLLLRRKAERTGGTRYSYCRLLAGTTRPFRLAIATVPRRCYGRNVATSRAARQVTIRTRASRAELAAWARVECALTRSFRDVLGRIECECESNSMGHSVLSCMDFQSHSRSWRLREPMQVGCTEAALPLRVSAKAERTCGVGDRSTDFCPARDADGEAQSGGYGRYMEASKWPES